MRFPLRRLLEDRRGTSAIEIALVAPLLAATIIGMSDMARGYSLKLEMEQAAQRTIEQVQAQKSVGSSYNTAIETEAGNAMTAAGYSTGNTVTPDSWVECSTNGSSWTKKTNFTDACAPAELTARYVSVSISRKFRPMFTSKRWPGTDSNGDFTVSGYAEVRIQ
jgi:Flp pilus assembly protein TadG